jgi:predicted nucleic acid-binding protein
VSLGAVLLDTGPVIALVTERDHNHSWATAAFAQIETEKRGARLPYPAAVELHRFLLFQKPPRVTAVLAIFDTILTAYPLTMPTAEDVAAATESMARYPDQKISLVDATIAAMTRRERRPVLTLDERHFELLGAESYRRPGLDARGQQ